MSCCRRAERPAHARPAAAALAHATPVAPSREKKSSSQVSPYAASLPAAYPYRALSRVALRVGPSDGQQYLVAALFEAVGDAATSSSSSSSSACADHCARGLCAALEGALADGLDPPAALRRAARELDAAFLSDASLPAWVRASSGATMSAVLLPVAAASGGGQQQGGADADAAGRRRAYAARLGAPPPFVARARGAFSNTTVECVAMQGSGDGGDSAPRSPTRAAAAAAGSACSSSPSRGGAGGGGEQRRNPHDGLALAGERCKQRICVRAIGLGYGKDARLAQAWATHCRRHRPSGISSSSSSSDDDDALAVDPPPRGAPSDGVLPPGLLERLNAHLSSPPGPTPAAAAPAPAFISCEPEVTAHALAPGEDAAVVLASAALRAALAPGELALLAHGFDARRLSAMRQAYLMGKVPASAAVAGAWAGVADCGGSRLGGGGAKGASEMSGLRSGENADLAAVPPPPPAPAPPQGEPNVARLLVHVARARALDAANREAARVDAATGARLLQPRLAAGGRLLPKALVKRAALRPLEATDATCLDLAADGEDLALALEQQRRWRRQKRGKKMAAAAAAAASFDDGTDLAGRRAFVLPAGYGEVPGAAVGDEAVDEQKQQQQQQQQQQQHQAPATTAVAPVALAATKRDVHGDLAAVVLALDWGGGGGGGLARAASLGTRGAAAAQAALAAAARSPRPAALYRWELVRLAVKARCARRRQLRAAWWAAAGALRVAADAAAREAEVAAWRVLGEAVHVTRRGDVVGADAAPAAAAAGGAAGARAVVMLGMGGSAKGPARAAAVSASPDRRG